LVKENRCLQNTHETSLARSFEGCNPAKLFGKVFSVQFLVFSKRGNLKVIVPLIGVADICPDLVKTKKDSAVKAKSFYSSYSVLD